ncbi:MAG: OmpA family protein [Paludibaculum sp.]
MSGASSVLRWMCCPPRKCSFSSTSRKEERLVIAESEALLPQILAAISERHSTEITVTGHTDTTADPQYNYQLGLRRAQAVARILTERGVAASDVFVSSHGQADLLVKTPNGVAEQRNRRVEVIVR